MRKSFITLATVTVVGLTSSFTINTVYAETDLQNKKAEVQNERSEVESKLSKAEAEVAEVLVELDELNEEIKQVEKALESNQKMIDDTNDKVKTTEDEIAELEKEIEKRSEILSNRMVNYQKNGGNIGFLDVIFGSQSFTDFISRVTAVNKITSSDQELINQLESDKVKVAEKLDELSELQTELAGMQETILAQKEQNDAKKKELSKKEKSIQKKIEDLELEASQLASIEAQVNREIAAQRAASNPVVASSGNNNSTKSDGSLTQLSKKTESKQSAPVAASNAAQVAINAGYPHLGTPYVWGGKGPGGFDCSGFVSWAYAQAGISLPSSTAAMQSVGTKVSYSDARPGDIVFFDTYKTNGHVGIYLGNGKFIGAQNSTGLAVADMSSGYWKDHFEGHVRRVAN
ncbi:C40 family peptidase [Ornithinibacillus sp. BX22]|uniref:C40 family peptidase n=2 Tax=Ornithinibacillus TaxID=484508 RepID=A0A923L837_9BACI|nr:MULTISPECIES: C40 family peptidase [Ornithinibacillus]MBC5638265.1 C40 family peptidase [Ornithinibacillus hominis]MBS3682107.1 C40 family peptidase [Ornithinibacillus massiliensis]